MKTAQAELVEASLKITHHRLESIVPARLSAERAMNLLDLGEADFELEVALGAPDRDSAGP